MLNIVKTDKLDRIHLLRNNFDFSYFHNWQKCWTPIYNWLPNLQNNNRESALQLAK